MPITDFGFEEILDRAKLTYLDTSALTFNESFFLGPESRKDLFDAPNDREALKRLNFSREQIEKLIEYNHTLAQLFRQEPNFLILKDSMGEHLTAEKNQAKLISLCCIREKLIRKYNKSVEDLRESMGQKILDRNGGLDARCKELMRDYEAIIHNSDLSSTDKRLLVYSIVGTNCGNVALLSNDRRLLTQANILGRVAMPRNDFYVYTMLKSDRFEEADGRHFLRRTSKKSI